MSNPSLEWSATEARPSAVLALVPVVRHELKRHAVFYTGIFAALALAALAVGVLLPKKYASNTTILVEQSNIIAPLMEGRAVATGVTNRATIAREVAFSRKVMGEILTVGGWMEDKPSPLQQDKQIEQIIDRTIISNPRENLIEIRYVDSDPTRAYKVTQRLADLVISESLATKERESREAYGFINSQVEQYHRKLTDAEAKLENLPHHQSRRASRHQHRRQCTHRRTAAPGRDRQARPDRSAFGGIGVAVAAVGRERDQYRADARRPVPRAPDGVAEPARPAAADLHRTASGRCPRTSTRSATSRKNCAARPRGRNRGWPDRRRRSRARRR